MPRREPVLPLEAGTTLVSLITWNSANSSQNSASKEEEVTFIKYWDRGNPWIETTRTTGETGLLRTEFLSPVLEGESLQKALNGARAKLPDIVSQLRAAPLSDDAVADNLVEAPQLPELAEEMIKAGCLDVLCDRIGDRTMNLRQLHWALGGETGALANICNFSEEALKAIVSRNLLPIILGRAGGLLTGEAEVGVNSVAARSVQLLAKFAQSRKYHTYVCDKKTVKLVLDVFGEKDNGIHNWNTRSHEKTWSVYLVFAWAGEFIASLALHDSGRDMLKACNAVRVLNNVTAQVEGATAKDYIDATLALLVNKERPTKKKNLMRKITFKKKAAKAVQGQGGHVMISYSWATQPLAVQLKEELEKNGHRVWIDLEKMEGNVMIRMAEAVEGADCVVVLLSKRYLQSRNCGLEAAYIQKLGTPFIAIYTDDHRHFAGDSWSMIRTMIQQHEAHEVPLKSTKLDPQTASQVVAKLGTWGKGAAKSAKSQAKSAKAEQKTVEQLNRRVTALETETTLLDKRFQALSDRLDALEQL